MASATPPPSPSPLLAVRSGYCTEEDRNFDVWGQYGANKVFVTRNNSGFATQFRFTGTGSSTRVQNGATLRSGGVSLSTHLIQVSDNVVLVAFKLQNDNSAAVSVDVSCAADLNVEGIDSSACRALDGGSGFSVSGSRFTFSMIGRSCSLVHDISTYWFGSRSASSLYDWDPTSAASFSGTDSACSWSWQKVSVPPGQWVAISSLWRSGDGFSDPPLLLLDQSAIPSSVGRSQILQVPGSVAPISPSVTIDILLMIDGTVTEVNFPGSSLSPGPFTLPLALLSYPLALGTHRFACYAVDRPYGRISTGVSASLEVVPDAMVSRSPSRAATASPGRLARPLPCPPARPRWSGGHRQGHPRTDASACYGAGRGAE
jgi:hypothetical protein